MSEKMFFRSRHKPTCDSSRVADHRDAGTDKATLRQTEQLMQWRRSAQRVTRAWNAWLAAERGDRSVRYQAFVAALAEEERAAAKVERMVYVPTADVCFATDEAQSSGRGEW